MTTDWAIFASVIAILAVIGFTSGVRRGLRKKRVVDVLFFGTVGKGGYRSLGWVEQTSVLGRPGAGLRTALYDDEPFLVQLGEVLVVRVTPQANETLRVQAEIERP